MSKGMRLSFYGVTCTLGEITALRSALGYNSYPRYSGWGSGGYRNFLGLGSASSLFKPCESLVAKGLMCKRKAPSFSCSETIFACTDEGIRWLARFRRNHPRADLKEWLPVY